MFKWVLVFAAVAAVQCEVSKEAKTSEWLVIAARVASTSENHISKLCEKKLSLTKTEGRNCTCGETSGFFVNEKLGNEVNENILYIPVLNIADDVKSDITCTCPEDFPAIAHKRFMLYLGPGYVLQITVIDDDTFYMIIGETAPTPAKLEEMKTHINSIIGSSDGGWEVYCHTE